MAGPRSDVLRRVPAERLRLLRRGPATRLPVRHRVRPEEAFNDPHFVARGFPTSVAHPELGREIAYPGAPFKSSIDGWRISRRRPSSANTPKRSSRTSPGVTPPAGCLRRKGKGEGPNPPSRFSPRRCHRSRPASFAR